MPRLVVAGVALRDQTVEHHHDVPVGIGVVGIPHGNGHHAERVFELFQIARFPHAEPLFQHLRTVESGHAHGHSERTVAEDDGTVHAASNLQFFVAQSSVRLPDAQRFRFMLEGPQLAVELVLPVFHGELVEIDGVDGVDGAAPARPAVEADHGHREADLRGAIKIVAGTVQMHFHIAVERVAPGQMRVDEEHRLATGGVGWPDGPGVGAGGQLVIERRAEFGNRAAALERRNLALHAFARAHVHIVDGAQGVADDIDAGNREDHAVLGADGIGMRFGEVVDAGREGVQVLAELRILRVIPELRAFGNAVRLHPAIQVQMRLSPVLRGAAPRFPVKKQQQVGLILRLRPPVSVEHGLTGGGEDVRDTVLVPEDLGFRRGDTSGGEKKNRQKAHSDSPILTLTQGFRTCAK